MSEADLARAGYGIDPANPAQAIPLDQIEICRIGKSELATADLPSLIALAQLAHKTILKAELSLGRLYWDWGDVLLAIRKRLGEQEKEKPRQQRKGWLSFVKDQGWEQRKVDKALRIRRKHATADALDNMTVADALNYATSDDRVDTGNSGATYILDDGRVVYYGWYGSRHYLWDGETIEFADLGAYGDDYEDWPEPLQPPTEEQLKAAAVARVFGHRPEVDQEADDQGDDETETTAQGNETAASGNGARAKPTLHTTKTTPAPSPKPKGKGKRNKPCIVMEGKMPLPGQRRWLVGYALVGSVSVYAESADEAEAFVQRCELDGRLDGEFQHLQANALNLLVDTVEEESEDDTENLNKPKAKTETKPARQPTSCQTHCRHALVQLRKDTGIKGRLKPDKLTIGGRTDYEVWHDGEKIFEGDVCCSWAAQAEAIKVLVARRKRKAEANKDVVKMPRKRKAGAA